MFASILPCGRMPASRAINVFGGQLTDELHPLRVCAELSRFSFIRRTGFMERWWHYTVGTTLIQIIAEGRIKRVTSGSRKAVWFTSRDSWEPTATKLTSDRSAPGGYRSATEEEMILKGGAL